MAKHSAEMRRCLISLDVVGATELWRKVAPHLADQEPVCALTCLHMARVESKYMPLKLKRWSLDWLAERGIVKENGQWTPAIPKSRAVAEAVGISSSSGDPRWSRRIERAMEDDLLNSMAKGITEAPWQKEGMLKARARVKFKARRI